MPPDTVKTENDVEIAALALKEEITYGEGEGIVTVEPNTNSVALALREKILSEILISVRLLIG